MSPPASVLVIGGSSGIGRAVALHYGAHGWDVILTARDVAECELNAQDIAIRTGRKPAVLQLDVLRTDRFAGFIDSLARLPDTVVCVAGLLGDQDRGQSDPAQATQVMRSNFEGPALLMEAFANRFAARGAGVLIAVSSVAGDRGRSSNYIYGSSKAGLTAYLSGLRQRLFRDGVCVITVKPGYVRTRMTAHLALPRALTVEPRRVAQVIFAADQAKRPRSIYVGLSWRLIMTIIGLLPEPLFLRTKL